jgi:chemotaxis signal transduction protein
MEYLPFRIAGRDFVVDASRVRAIVPFERLEDPSGQQSHPAPVIDLRARLGLPPIFYGRRPYLVVVETRTTADTPVSESGLASFAVDYVSDLIHGSPKECRRGKLRTGGRPKWVLDPDSLRIEGR